MFQQTIDEIFKGLPNIFCTVGDIFVGYDADRREHNKTLRWIVQIYWQENLKLNKNKCHLRGTRIPFWKK